MWGLAMLFLIIMAIFAGPFIVVLRDVSVREESNREHRQEVEEQYHNEMMAHIEAAFAQGMQFAQQGQLVDLDDTLAAF
ncbi:MAG TPA: hypothetical protein VF221_01600 [Chloroflexota bacterium]